MDITCPHMQIPEIPIMFYLSNVHLAQAVNSKELDFGSNAYAYSFDRRVSRRSSRNMSYTWVCCPPLVSSALQKRIGLRSEAALNWRKV